MHKNDAILAVALIGLTFSFACICWLAYQQSRLVSLIKEHTKPNRPITRAELRNAAYRLFPNEVAIARLFIGNIVWQMQVMWREWPTSTPEIRRKAQLARIAMCAAILSVLGVFAALIAVALIQHNAGL